MKHVKPISRKPEAASSLALLADFFVFLVQAVTAFLFQKEVSIK